MVLTDNENTTRGVRWADRETVFLDYSPTASYSTLAQVVKAPEKSSYFVWLIQGSLRVDHIDVGSSRLVLEQAQHLPEDTPCELRPVKSSSAFDSTTAAHRTVVIVRNVKSTAAHDRLDSGGLVGDTAAHGRILAASHVLVSSRH